MPLETIADSVLPAREQARTTNFTIDQ